MTEQAPRPVLSACSRTTCATAGSTPRNDPEDLEEKLGEASSAIARLVRS